MTDPEPPRRFRVGYWIAGVASVAIAALLVYGAIQLAAPARLAYSFATGNPTMPDCDTTIAREATVGPLWYRVVHIACGKESMHMVFAKRGTGPGWFVHPTLMTIGDPVPLSVREAGTDAFEVVLSAPLADGRTAVAIQFDGSGSISTMESFENGRQRDADDKR